MVQLSQIQNHAWKKKFQTRPAGWASLPGNILTEEALSIVVER